jgi:uncharacterized repeat protein (TIGR03803 family)
MKPFVVLAIFTVGCAACSPRFEQDMAPGSSRASFPLGAHGRSNFKTLLAFNGGYGGARPVAGLIVKGTIFYGTTSSAGLFGHGNIFRLTADGHEKVIHSFHYDGDDPTGKLLRLGETLYGTTVGGGAHNSGTVFGIKTGGKEDWAYSFKGSDGEQPDGPLVELNGALYGTTEYGGKGGECENYTCGTIFKISTSGSATTIYNFSAGNNGANPQSGLIKANGRLYGTASGGQYQDGVVFTVTSTGKESVVYAFGSRPSDGRFPNGLVALNGTLYGTTLLGGTQSAGTVFSVTPSGREKLLYSFSSGSSDGNYPKTALTAYNGRLYGTTDMGGSGFNGTLFEMSTSGSEHTLHNFTGRTDGGEPQGSLLELGGKLYGTTVYGGGSTGIGSGVVYELTP